MSIECRAWAGNIEYRGGSHNRAGSVTFEVQIDAENHILKEDIHRLHTTAQSTHSTAI